MHHLVLHHTVSSKLRKDWIKLTEKKKKDTVTRWEKYELNEHVHDEVLFQE